VEKTNQFTDVFSRLHLPVTEAGLQRDMKCDLHVHTLHSGLCTLPVANRFCRESYSEPEAVYLRLKQKGMDLVTVTDHDSIGAADALRRHPNFFSSEEVTVRMPSGAEAHVAVYGLDERQHEEVQRRRNDVPALVAYLEEQRLPSCINHVFSRLTGRREREDWTWFEQAFPLVETLNGAMPAAVNRKAAELASRWGKPGTGGSDAHALRSVGSAWTEVPDARNAEEFLAGLRAGRGRVQGKSGNYWKLMTDVLQIIAGLFEENRRARWLAPAVAALPVVTLINLVLEAAFAGRWSFELLRGQPVKAPAILDANAGEEAPA
jgi:predicted metal-dependent phosphoesterase TrpH